MILGTDFSVNTMTGGPFGASGVYVARGSQASYTRVEVPEHEDVNEFASLSNRIDCSMYRSSSHLTRCMR